MSSGKPTTPVSSPKIPRTAKFNSPSTPPSTARAKVKRLLATYLKTPEQNTESVPFSPSLKRTSSGHLKSPDYKLNTHNVLSPYSSGSLLKTPRHSGYESDENKHDARLRLLKTPQYFSPGKKLFSDDTSPNKDDLSEISSQLKNRLSSALGKMQQQQQLHLSPGKLDFTELSFSSSKSPTKKLKSSLHSTPREKVSPSASVQKANINLQTLQLSPLPAYSPPASSSAQFEPRVNPGSPNRDLRTSPILTRNPQHSLGQNERVIDMPSPNEESSAHNALMAALSRQRRKSRGSFSSNKRQSLHELDELTTKPPSLKLPPINVALSGKEKDERPAHTEQDAVLSLMSLSSPQARKFSHSRTQSLNTNSAGSSRSSSVVLTSPQPTQSQPHPTLPPISGLINLSQFGHKTNADNDETDVEDDATDDDADR